MADLIAIDGPAGSGKSTTARLAAGRLGFEYLDTGAMYRITALLALRNGIPPADGEAVAAILPGHSVEVLSDRAILDGEDVSGRIRTAEVGDAASIVSTCSAVRSAMVGLQRAFARDRNVVAEGRDMGTVVFPDAVLKVYILADMAVRAVRRVREFTAAGRPVCFTELVLAMLKRDRRDREREDSPLRPAPGAVWLDTSLLTVRGQVDRVLRLYRERLGNDPE